jgi:hypothetical protein
MTRLILKNVIEKQPSKVEVQRHSVTDAFSSVQWRATVYRAAEKSPWCTTPPDESGSRVDWYTSGTASPVSTEFDGIK